MARRDLNQNVATIQSDYAQYQEEKRVQRAKRRRKVFARLSLILAIFGVFLAAVIYMDIYQGSYVDDKLLEQEQYKAELTELLREEEHLEQEITNLNNDEYILKLARLEYFFSRPGESIFIVPKED